MQHLGSTDVSSIFRVHLFSCLPFVFIFNADISTCSYQLIGEKIYLCHNAHGGHTMCTTFTGPNPWGSYNVHNIHLAKSIERSIDYFELYLILKNNKINSASNCPASDRRCLNLTSATQKIPMRLCHILTFCFPFRAQNYGLSWSIWVGDPPWT